MIKHFIISRVAAKWFNEKKILRCESELNMKWEDWSKQSIDLYNTYTRKSLKNQTNQNFELLSIIDKDIEYLGELLPNEKIIRVSNINESVKKIKEYLIEKVENKDILLLSRIDRDDCYKNDFVENIQEI